MDDIRKFPGRFPEEPYRNEDKGRNMPEYRGGQKSYREYGGKGIQDEWRNMGGNMDYGCPFGGCGSTKKPLPFYMTYPMPMYWDDGDDAVRDLEYFLQLYPEEARRYQKKIMDILDTMDYNGSLIYDEYPDRLAMYRLSEGIIDKILREEERAELSGQIPANAFMENRKTENQEPVQIPAQEPGKCAEGTQEEIPSAEKRQMEVTSHRETDRRNKGDLIQVLLYYEIFRRRHGRGGGCGICSSKGRRNNGFLKF